MPYVFHPAAEAEHLQEIAFYEARRPGLGARYLADVETTLANIDESPGLYRIERTPDIRRAGLSHFLSVLSIVIGRMLFRCWPSAMIAAGLDIGLTD